MQDLPTTLATRKAIHPDDKRDGESSGASYLKPSRDLFKLKPFTLWYSEEMARYFNEKPIEINIEGKIIHYNVAFDNDADHSLAWPDSVIVAKGVEL